MNYTSSARSTDGVDRQRSRSPYRGHRRDQAKRQRSRSPQRNRTKHHHHRHHHRSSQTSQHASRPSESAKLPFRQNALQRSEYDKFKALFAYYLDVQKRMNLYQLPVDEAKGRWKSFMGKWNRGELAEGWYDPMMQETAKVRYGQNRSAAIATDAAPEQSTSWTYERRINISMPQSEDDDEDEGPGPAPPAKSASRAGPSIPTTGDIQHRHELAEEDRLADLSELRHSRKQDRTLQKERLEELVPRAEPGSKERQMEKKREVAAVNREFRDAKEAGDVEVGEKELMGGDDGVEGYRAQLKAREKIKNEREVRKEEVLRARAAERQERIREARAKEDKTMEMLKTIAKQRFG